VACPPAATGLNGLGDGLGPEFAEEGHFYRARRAGHSKSRKPVRHADVNSCLRHDDASHALQAGFSPVPACNAPNGWITLVRGPFSDDNQLFAASSGFLLHGFFKQFVPMVEQELIPMVKTDPR
jgi:hypothetical protein